MRKYLFSAALALFSLVSISDNYISGSCPSGGGGGSPVPGGGAPGISGPVAGGSSAQRPFLGIGLQPQIQSLQSLNNVADPWEVWWTRNRDRYLSFREPITWTIIEDKGGTKSYSVSPFYDKLISVMAEVVNDKDFNIAFRAAIALGKAQDSINPSIGSSHALEILKKAHEKEKRDFVRNNILLGLGLTSDASAVSIIKDVLLNKDTPPLRRSFAALALSYPAHTPEVSKALQEIVSSAKEDREVKSSACLALGNLRDESAVPVLGKVLTGAGGKKEQAMIRANAALGLGRIGNRQAIKELSRITPDNEREPDVLSAVVVALGMTGLPEARESVNIFLPEKNPGLQGLACIALAQIKDSTAYEIISEMLRKNKSPDSDGLMLIALGLTGHENAKSDLRKVLADSKKSRSLLRSAAAIGLGLLKDKEALPIIVSIIKDNKNQSDTTLAPYLILTLAMISGEKKDEAALKKELTEPEKQVVEILQKMWDKADKNLTITAYSNLAVALMKLTSRNSMIEELTKHAGSNEPAVRAYAIHTLGMIGNRDSARVFIDAATDSNAEVRKAVMAGIGFLMDKNTINPIDMVTADSIDMQMRIMDHILPIPVW